MSAGILTDAGRDLFAAKQGAGQVLTIDRFMLANIVGLDPNDPADPLEALPAPGDQVATLPVTKSGYVSADKVVYSLYLGTQVGDFTFNWVGLLADDDTLVAVRYIEPISKYATSGQDLGNAITRNFLITYTDAQAITNVTVEASSWQWQFDYATELAAGLIELATLTEQDAESSETLVPPVKVVADYVGNAASNATAYTDSGAANAYVLTPSSSRKGPRAYLDGAVYEFIAANANTGASTVNVAGLGAKNIKLKGGGTPAAGEIRGRTRLRYDAANGWLELDRLGRIKTTYVTVSDAAWVPQPDTKAIRFTAIGAGGGGGGVDGQGAGTAANSSHGGGGGFAIKTTSRIEATYNITIGAGGPGGAAGNNAGSAGGNTSVLGALINVVANGGGGGPGNTGTAGSGLPGQGAPGSSLGGDLNGSGTPGASGRVISAEFVATGLSGHCPVIGAGLPTSIEGAGNNATRYGEGGGGVATDDVATNYAGGDGGDGFVIIEEFF